jgi:hypothetical protein
MKRLVLVLVLGVASACANQAAPPQQVAAAPVTAIPNPVAGETASESRADSIDGWFLVGTGPSHYRVERDPGVKHGGTASARITAVSDPGDKFGTLMQAVAANDYAGKRVRLSAFVRTGAVAEWSGLWMRIDREGGQMGAFDNMQNRPIRGTTEWTRHSVVLVVSPDAKTVNFGVLQHGRGTTWIDDVRLETVDDTVATTDMGGGSANDSPTNLGFDD